MTTKVAELAEKFVIKIAEHQYDSKAPPSKKLSDFSPQERDFINHMAGQDENQAQDELDLNDKIWKKAKKAVKKYWKKYDEPYAVVYSVYKNMGGKPDKKKKKKKKS